MSKDRGERPGESVTDLDGIVEAVRQKLDRIIAPDGHTPEPLTHDKWVEVAAILAAQLAAMTGEQTTDPRQRAKAAERPAPDVPAQLPGQKELPLGMSH